MVLMADWDQNMRFLDVWYLYIYILYILPIRFAATFLALPIFRHGRVESRRGWKVVGKPGWGCWRWVLAISCWVVSVSTMFIISYCHHTHIRIYIYIFIFTYYTIHMFFFSVGKLLCYVCITKMDLIVICMCACSSRVGKHVLISLLTESFKRRWKSPKTRNM